MKTLIDKLSKTNIVQRFWLSVLILLSIAVYAFVLSLFESCENTNCVINLSIVLAFTGIIMCVLIMLIAVLVDPNDEPKMHDVYILAPIAPLAIIGCLVTTLVSEFNNLLTKLDK